MGVFCKVLILIFTHRKMSFSERSKTGLKIYCENKLVCVEKYKCLNKYETTNIDTYFALHNKCHLVCNISLVSVLLTFFNTLKDLGSVTWFLIT